MRKLLISWVLGVGVACGVNDSSLDGPARFDAGPGTPTEPPPQADAADDAPDEPASDAATDADATPPRPALMVDRSDPQLYQSTFAANEADPAAAQSLGTQGAYLDTRVESVGKLVVFLHGAGSEAPTNCNNGGIGNLLAPKGFHVFSPCYNSYYGVGNCGDTIGECRREAFEGVDHTDVIDIAPADAIEPRIVAALRHLAAENPKGHWDYFLDGDAPYWPDIIISGISHGASSAGLIAKLRPVHRAVMLSGPLDSNQAWLQWESETEASKFFGFTHTGDSQNAGHVAAFETLGLPGALTNVDETPSPYNDARRLQSSATTDNGHGATAPGNASPRENDAYVYTPVWAHMFGYQ